MMPSPTPYADVLAGNIRAERSRLGINQEALATRMRALGYSAWLRQTVANVEKTRRRVTAEEVLGLALALQSTIAELMRPAERDGDIQLPNGEVIGGVSVERLAGAGLNDHAVNWRDGTDEQPSYARLARLPGRGPFDLDLLSRPLFATADDGRVTRREDVQEIYLQPTGHRHDYMKSAEEQGCAQDGDEKGEP